MPSRSLTSATLNIFFIKHSAQVYTLCYVKRCLECILLILDSVIFPSISCFVHTIASKHLFLAYNISLSSYRCSSEETWKWSSWHLPCCCGRNSWAGYKCKILDKHILILKVLFLKVCVQSLSTCSHSQLYITVIPPSRLVGKKTVIHKVMQNYVYKKWCHVWALYSFVTGENWSAQFHL